MLSCLLFPLVLLLLLLLYWARSLSLIGILFPLAKVIVSGTFLSYLAWGIITDPFPLALMMLTSLWLVCVL
uniref:NADH dehydrogenase subunit 4L n=1 Tax=Kudoa hexapunctata TaxID=1450334 RepID=A0A0H5BIF7_9CNID|nr:NADH dehydrogenase subunit 4L [Kudoa hexapunctata]BAR94704.1 NADH dehydrogenase subunit 4L [Kudoa hexapunctata]